jgi:hypothetical protein
MFLYWQNPCCQLNEWVMPVNDTLFDETKMTDKENRDAQQIILDDVEVEDVIEEVEVVVEEEEEKAISDDVNSEDDGVIHKRMKKETAESRRIAIKFLYIHVFGAPPVSSWKEIYLVVDIMQRLSIPKNSETRVKKLLVKIATSHAQNLSYNCKEIRNKKGGIIKDNSREAVVIYKALEAGLSVTLTCYLVNTWRQEQNPPLPPICWSAIQTFITGSEVIVRTRRQKKKWEKR